jgi:hypothetical protein
VCSDPQYVAWSSDNCCMYCATHGGMSTSHKHAFNPQTPK